MKYTMPENVKSPQDSVKILRVLRDKGEESYSLAELNPTCY